MKTIFSVLVTLFALSSFAAPIDARFESLIVENPTLKNHEFSLSSAAAVYVCKTLGYDNAIVLANSNPKTNPIWLVESVNNGFSLNLVNRNSPVIAKLECQRKFNAPVVVPPINQPCDGCDDIPTKPPVDPTNPYDPKP